MALLGACASTTNNASAVALSTGTVASAAATFATAAATEAVSTSTPAPPPPTAATSVAVGPDGFSPLAAAVNGTTNRVYVTNISGDTVSVIDGGTTRSSPRCADATGLPGDV